MQHISEVLKIIEGGVKGNSTQVVAYAKLLAEKLEKDGFNRQSTSVLKRISSTASLDSQSFSANFVQHTNYALPIDKDSRLTLGDETWPSLNDNKIQLDKLVSTTIEEFLTFIDNSTLLEDAGVGISPSILLYGPPGCGKTKLANHIAARLELPLITARCDTLISSYLGSTSKNIRNLFDHVSSRPCVLFLDEFDAFAKARDDQHELGELKRVVVSLLQNIDSLPTSTILIAATNHESLLDPAVWRRFSYRLKIGLPDANLRYLIIQQHLRDFSPSNIKPIVEMTNGMNGAIIQQACLASIRRAIIKNKKTIDINDIIIDLIHIQYSEIIYADADIDAKIERLRRINPKVCTVQRLAQIFDVSIGKISNLTSHVKENE